MVDLLHPCVQGECSVTILKLSRDVHTDVIGHIQTSYPKVFANAWVSGGFRAYAVLDIRRKSNLLLCRYSELAIST